MKKFLPFLVVIVFFSCTKKSDSPSVTPAPDLAKGAAGTYYVTSINNDNISTVAVTDKNEYLLVTETAANVVSIEVHLTTGISTLYNVKLTDGGNGKTNLNYIDASAQISGYMQGNFITFTDVVFDANSDFIIVTGQK
jgi:hypothetical protein